MNDPYHRAALIAAISDLLAPVTAELVRLMDATAIPNHRMSTLITSLAWHQRRPTPEDRLAMFAYEVARLWQTSDGAPDRQVEATMYLYLIHHLGLGSELAAIRDQRSSLALRLSNHERLRLATVLTAAGRITPAPAWYLGLAPPGDPASPPNQWAAAGRLMFSQRVLEILNLIQRSRGLREAITAEGGTLL